MTDIRQNNQYSKYLRSLNWIVEEKDEVYYYIKKIFFFSIIKIQRPKKIDLKHIEKLAKKYRAFQVVIEPNIFKEADMLINKNWQNIFPYVPSKTIILQLNKSEGKIYDDFDKGTRYSVRKSSSIKIKAEKDLKEFRRCWRKSVDLRRYVLSTKELGLLRDAFKEDCIFLVAQDGISGGIFLVAGDTAYYWYGFVSKEGRRKLSQYKLLWEGIKWAKSRGAKYFDMEGIYDERFPIPAWKGFTKFKKGFGGKVVKYPGAYQKTVLPF